jgi:hypothetical protein
MTEGEDIEWEFMIEFVGGPLDGQTLATDVDSEFDSDKALWILRLAAASRNIAQRQERKPENLLTWRVPHRLLAEKANAEQWSPAQRKALIEHHEYHVTDIEEGEGLAILKAFYRGYG